MPPALSVASFGTVINERKGTFMGLDMYALATAEAVEAEVDFTPDIAACTCTAPLTEASDGGTSDA